MVCPFFILFAKGEISPQGSFLNSSFLRLLLSLAYPLSCGARQGAGMPPAFDV